MLWIKPQRTTLLGSVLHNVESIAVDRTAERTAEEWSDLGPHRVFIDVPEERVTIKVVRKLNLHDDASGAATPLGAEGTLSFTTAATAGDTGASTVTITVVVTSVSHTIDGKGATQRVVCAAVSADGAADPITTQGAKP